MLGAVLRIGPGKTRATGNREDKRAVLPYQLMPGLKIAVNYARPEFFEIYCQGHHPE